MLGRTDATASKPDGEGYTPDDVAATFYHHIGLDPHREFAAITGRPVMLVRDGKVIKDLLN